MDESCFCEYCGARLDQDSRFCETCGTPVSEVPAEVSAVPSGCPKCGQVERTNAVAEFVEEDLSSMSEEEGKAQQAAQISLAAPDPPAPPSLALWAVIPFIPGVNALTIWFAPMHKDYKLVMLAIAVIFISCVAVPSLYENDAYIIPGLLIVTVYYCGLIFDRKRQLNELRDKRLPEYRRKAATWRRLTYCKRCHVVWLSGPERNFVPVENVDELLEERPVVSQARVN
jgi:hypothetical protein